jgi:predicted Holliday junction resolvase-like endonuclease
METVYYLFLIAITMVAVFLTGVYYKTLVRRYRRLFPRKKRKLTTKQRIEQLEKRVDLHTRKDGVYLSKFDEFEEQIQNISEAYITRDSNVSQRIRREVRKYLEELQK